MPKKVELSILLENLRKRQGGTILEEKYVSVSRGGGRRVQEPPRQPAAQPKRRSKAKSLFWGFYKFLVVISAIIVAVFVAFQLLVKPPEQTPPSPVPEQTPVNNPLSPSGSGAASSEEEPERALERRDGVYTVLLAATDKEGFRTDTMMVMTYDVPNQKVGVISVPRDTLIDRGSGKNPKLVYGSGGVKERREEISAMLGIPIDYYIKVNINAFVALVDYVGGVDFYVPCDMNYDDPYQDLSIHFKEGQRHLNGQEAMEVARFRKNNDLSGYSDVGRTQTQQQLLVALAKKVLSWDSLTKINGFVELFNKYVSTDLELSDMIWFASQAICLDTSSGVETATLEGRGDAVFRGQTYCYELDREKTVELVNRLVNPFDGELCLEDMNLVRAQRYMT